MTPYAKAHLRLLTIQRRWGALITSKVRCPVLSDIYQIKLASVTGGIALQMVEDDQDFFDMEVHSIDADAPTEENNTAALLVHAYARGEACGGSTDWDDINQAWEKACQELGPERVAEIRKLYIEDDEEEEEDSEFIGENHPRHDEWQEEVTQGNTLLGLADWLEHNPVEETFVDPSEYVEPDFEDPEYRGPRPPYL